MTILSFRKVRDVIKVADRMINSKDKEALRRDLVASLHGEKEIRKIVIFGSFLRSEDPHDMDIAVFQDSSEAYLPLALRYRRKTRSISQRIPLDIIPLRVGVRGSSFLAEIEKGEVIYEA